MIKKTVAIVLLAISPLIAFTQEKESGARKLPSVIVKTLKGENLNTSKLSNDGKPFVIDFWATWCKPCIQELTAIHENYADWIKETGVKVIAISIDDARNSMKVAPFVNGKAWDYEIFIDENADLKRALNVNDVPHTFVLNGKGEIVWQHQGYKPGDESELYEIIKKVSAGKDVSDSK